MHHHHHAFAAHHGHRRLGGRFGRGFLDRADRGGRAVADLQLLILGLLAEKPCHGYEIIKALEERSKGFYVPSPGTVYPALTYLEEIGHATAETEGSRKLYHIAVPGREHLEAHRGRAETLFTEFVSKELRRARKDLKRALAEKWDGSSEEEQRVIGILKRATAEILGQ